MPTPNEQLKAALARPKKRSKYRNTPVVSEGVRYDSKAELTYKGILDLRVRAGEITGYDYHVKLPLIAIGGGVVGYYEVDFLVYLPDGKQEYHDVKGKPNDVFPWKARHVQAQYGSPIILIDPKTFKPKNK